MSEFEPTPRFVIEDTKLEDIDIASEMRMQSWLDTYVNEDFGVTSEWVKERFAGVLSDENREKREKRFLDGKESGNLNAWVAKDEKGRIVGSTTPFVQEDGTQRVGSIYVDKNWHGTGVGTQLMQKVVDWFDPEKPISLEVVSYNERAKAFYRKWGFEEVNGSEAIYTVKLPIITMTRQPQIKPEGDI